MSKRNRFSSIELAVSPGAVLRAFDERETQQWVEKWMAVFVGEVLVPGLRQYLWHTFSYGNYPAITGAEADRLYATHQSREVLVLSSDQRSALLTNSLPTWCSRADYCVFPPDLAWTMAFTHEAGWLGPYFAKHPDYENLMEKTKQLHLAANRKAIELERGKQRGWI